MIDIHSLKPKKSMIFRKLKLEINQKQKFQLPIIQNRNSSKNSQDKHLSRKNLNETFIFNSPILPKILNGSLFDKKKQGKKGK